jgi:hypothetical protein
MMATLFWTNLPKSSCKKLIPETGEFAGVAPVEYSTGGVVEADADFFAEETVDDVESCRDKVAPVLSPHVFQPI